MVRQDFVNIMNNQNITPDIMYQFVQRYHKEEMDKDWAPKQCNLMDLQVLLNYILELGCVKYNVCLVKDKKGNVIKIY